MYWLGISPKLPDVYGIYYGSGSYKEVTTHICNKFRNQLRKQLVIEDNVVFNDHFGDPVPGIVKYLIVKQKNHLMVYPEINHGKIVINLY